MSNAVARNGESGLRAPWSAARAHTVQARCIGLLPVLALCALIVIYWACVFHPASLAYVDYVDGYYLYVAQRMAEGAVLYSHVMGVQPPGIYLVGDALFRLHDSLSTARCYSAALHSLTVLLVFATAQRLFDGPRAGLLAAFIYSLTPYSLVWSRTFDPNPLVTSLSMASLLALLVGTPRSVALAGVLGALALATKIWYLPIGVATLLFLVLYRRALLWPYVCACASCLVIICVAGSISAGSAFWQGLLVQDASGLSLTWLLAALFDVVQHDWPLLLLAAAGVALSRGVTGTTPPSAPTSDMLVCARWYLAASLLVLGATIKVGTFSPVFQFAEPALAIFAAAFLDRCLVSAGAARREAVSGRAGGWLFLCLIAAGLLIWALPSLDAVRGQSDASVRTVVARIQQASAPDSPLLAPPFYLYLAGRREVGEYADVNLWALSDARGDRAARALTRRVVVALRARAIPLVVLDSRVARLPGVESALHARYHRLPFRDPLPADRAVSLWTPDNR